MTHSRHSRELFVAVLERSYRRVHDTFVEAAAQARRDGRPPLEAMGAAYTDLLQDPELLLTQLQGHAAASEPEVREALEPGLIHWRSAGLVGNTATSSASRERQEHATSHVPCVPDPEPANGVPGRQGSGPVPDLVELGYSRTSRARHRPARIRVHPPPGGRGRAGSGDELGSDS